MPRILLAVLAGMLAFGTAQADDDILLADFEGRDYGAWKVTGTAFGPGPARGTLPKQMPVSGYLGNGLVNSYFGGDGSTGTLTSPPFKVERKYINFLIGGGKHEGQTCINLRVAGKLVRTATGPNDRPGGSERLDWHTWDVRDLAGKQAVIEIVDRHTGGWGHVNIDHIVQSDRRKMAEPARRTVVVARRYLHLPVKAGAPMRRMKFLVAGKTVREFDIELAEDEADFMVFCDIAAFTGKPLTIETTLPADSTALERVVPADDVPDRAGLYREPLRPQFHFTARRGWLNDPNGMVYHNGEYHLFFQHNPYGCKWGNMHWGHAVSRDLVHWQELGEALYPRQYGDWCFSGSAADDGPNRLLLAFTSTGRGECIAVSTDAGRTWTEEPGNPVVKHRGRDPRLLWHAPSKRWVMAVYDEEKGRTIAFYTSADRKAWRFESRIGEFFECPDLFELPIDGDTKKTKWVLYGADGRYVVGTFDGKTFTAEPGRHRLWHGPFYAAQTFSNAPAGRRIQIGWAQIDFPGMPFNQQMTFPVELRLRTTPDGVRMFAEPVAELAKLQRQTAAIAGDQWQTVIAGKPLTTRVGGALLDIRADAAPIRRAALRHRRARGIPIAYDAKKQTLTCGKVTAPVALDGGTLRLRMLVDRASVEVFANDGRVALIAGVSPSRENTSVAVFTEGGDADVRNARVTALRSAWFGE